MRKIDVTLDTSKLLGWQSANAVASTKAGGLKPDPDTISAQIGLTKSGVLKPDPDDLQTRIGLTKAGGLKPVED